jgi:flagellar M-ring protein FliF
LAAGSFFRAGMADTREMIAQLARSGRMRIAAALLVTALVGGGLGAIILRGEGGDKALLFSGLDLEEAAEISQRLDTANIEYTLEGGGSAIFVDRASVDDARMMLSEQGLPTKGSVGWEIFDKTDAFGATTFVQNINKIRALEGELGRSIASLEMVKAARVHLVIPEQSLFKRESARPSASVILSMTGNAMTPEKVRAIRNLVASSVPGLTVEAITVVDDQGRMLASGTEADPTAAGGAGLDERKLTLEESYRKKIIDVVENIAGQGAARVQVALDVDFNRVTQSSETFDPEGRVVRSSNTVEDSSRSTDMQPADETTVANNVPTGAPAPAAPAQPTSQTEQNRSEEMVNYEISKNTRTEIIEGGRIKRLSVAVAVDDAMVPGANGAAPTFQPRSPEEIARILSLVRSAVGFDEARGDVVTVENVSFARPNVDMTEAEAPGPFSFDKFDLVRAAELGALLVTALALVFFVLRPLAKGLFTKDDGGDPLLAAPSGSARRALPGQAATGVADDGMLQASAGGEPRTIAIDIPASERLDAGIDVARITGQVRASSIRKMSEVVANHPDESITIIRSWLAEDGGRA